ncbi:hypothetical protein OUZ56_016000 [Daphnia magna]|uniref:Uncharacterized protein n=1 Tax=Daphnia magna TaxID=35525 RepID=A0ABR0APC7_9CRUS|nr:hypothetical protein OUZ56_016000 [Daphnia magna]
MKKEERTGFGSERSRHVAMKTIFIELKHLLFRLKPDSKWCGGGVQAVAYTQSIDKCSRSSCWSLSDLISPSGQKKVAFDSLLTRRAVRLSMAGSDGV